MEHKIKRVLFGLLLLKALKLIQAEEVSFEHDVTKQVDSWILKVFKVNGDSTRKLFNTITNKKLQNYSQHFNAEISPSGLTLHFREVSMQMYEYKAPRINWKFSENKMGLFIKEFLVGIKGTLYCENNVSAQTQFEIHLELHNVTCILSITEEEKTSQEISYNNYKINYDSYSTHNWKQYGLHNYLKMTLPNLLRENIKHNEEFAKIMRSLFKAYSGNRNKIISTHSDFFINQNKYYYLIPKISFFCFNLKNIFLRGLWNLDWLKIDTGFSIFKHALMVREVRGSLTLDFGVPQEKPVEMQFKIDYLSISIEKKFVNIDARCYSINKTNNKPLTYRQSALIMQKIESAIAESLFPMSTHRRTFDIESPLEQIKIDKNSDWKNIKTSFHDWIPFNDDVTKSPSVGPGLNQTKPLH